MSAKKENILTSDPGYTYFEKAPDIQADEFQKVIDSRRSVRVFDGSPIPAEVVERCLSNALLAPNSSNLQPWEFYWVQSEDRRKALVRACFSQVAAKKAAELIVVVARTKTWKAHAKEMYDLFVKLGKGIPQSALVYYGKLAPLAYAQGPLGLFGHLKRVIYAVRGLSGPTLREPVNHSQLRTWAIKTTALAAENIMLSFRALGYDTCPMEGYDSKRIRKLLGLARDAVVVMVIAAGRRAPGGIYGPRLRFDPARFIKKV
jgi:nitroreductase